MMTFKKTHNYPEQGIKSIEFNTEAVTLSEVLEDFETFLKGCGYIFDGKIEIVEEDD